MFEKIVYISNNEAHIKINQEEVSTNMMNMYVVFEEGEKRILGEINDISDQLMKINFLGEFEQNRFLPGLLRKPNFSSKIRMITEEELALIIGNETPRTLLLGKTPLYNQRNVYVDINDLFSNHFAIFGNTGSGKSYGVARILQNVFENPNLLPFKSNILLFDTYGEYHNALENIDHINPNLNFKFYTTNIEEAEGGNILSIPLWLLTIEDMCLLLEAEEHSQVLIIEKLLNIVSIFSKKDEKTRDYKNHLIAKAIMTILYSNETASHKRNDIFSIFSTCSTPQFSLEAPVQGIGYVRKFRECFLIDSNGQFTESILVTEYVSSFIKEEFENYYVGKPEFYTLEDLEKALNFTLISEGYLNNTKTYADAVALKVKLHSLVIGEYAKFFRYPTYISFESYIASLVSKNGKKAQIINFNLEDVDDSFAKIITKIYMHMLFEFTKRLKKRASIPFHVFLEEAHRFVQEDKDKYLLGYNIFERVAKEGRKYGLLMGIISQRPVELSDTVISQCTNFIIFKMNHPRDLEYVRKMLPNISSEIIEKQKSLQPGTCVAFGKAFKIPLIIRMELPSPEPYSSNCNIIEGWKV